MQRQFREVFYNFANISTLSALNFRHLLLINFIKSISKDRQNKNIRIFWINWYICLLQQFIENYISIVFFVVAFRKLCGTTWYFKYFVFVVNQYWQQTWLYKIISTEISYKWLKEVLWKNPDHSLLSCIFCPKHCKCTLVSNCPLSSRKQFLALIPLYTSFTYSIDNGFKLPPGSVNVITVLNHSLYL